jgi:type II secretory pathway pseudopilin PulG
MRCSSAKGRTGFTLFEVLVALLIAAAGFGAILSGLAGAQRASERAGEARRELRVAQSLIELAYLGDLPPDAYVGGADGEADTWKGEREGVAWSVTISASATRGMNTASPDERLGGRPRLAGEPEPLLEMRVVRVRAGRVELTTVQW